jgi:hypothetical protein
MTSDRPKRSWKKTGAWIAGILALATLAVAVWIGLRPALQFASLPNPNGYDDLRRAAEAIVGQEPGPKGDWTKASKEELSAFVGPNQKALTLARVGLGRSCRVPMSSEPGTLDAQIADHIQWSSSMRRLARLLACEARIARMEDRHDDAVRSSLDLVRLGHEAGRGGMMIDDLAGQAIVATGLGELRALRDDLSAAECRRVMRELEAIDAGKEPVDDVLSRERALGKNLGVWQVRVFATFTPVFSRLLKPAEDSTEFAHKRTSAGLHLLIADLAVRAYRHEHGDTPETLSQLVPDILAAVPSDPFLPGNRPLVYRKRSSGVLLYSVGPDGKDDGGTPMGKVLPNGAGDFTPEMR